MPGKKSIQPLVLSHSYRLSSLILFLLSLLYLGVELFFNVMLLDVSSAVRSNPDQVEHVQYFGRAASGFGFTLLVLGIFQRFDFRISGWKRWLIFSVIAFICLLPFMMVFGQIAFGAFKGGAGLEDTDFLGEIFWGFLPFLGLFLVTLSRGRSPAAVMAGLMVLAWPAMFYGQKLAVERFVIAPTTVQDRLNANYILLIKAGIEECAVALEGVQLCDAGDASAEKRSTRAVLGALFMLNPPGVFQSLGPEQGQIVAGMASRGLWFSSQDYYLLYINKVALERRKYEKILNDSYQPYKRASALYFESLQPQRAEKMADDAVSRVENGMAEGERRYRSATAEIEGRIAQGDRLRQDAGLKAEAGIEQGWQKYRKAVSDYRIALNEMVEGYIQKLAPLAAPPVKAFRKACQGDECLQDLRLKYNDYCRTGKCEGMTADALVDLANQMAEQNFYDVSGYPMNIPDKAAFLQHPTTQRKLREDIEKNIRDTSGDRDFRLPEKWKYDPAAFDLYLQQFMQEKIRGEVEKNLQDMTGDRDFRLPEGWKYDRASFDAYVQPLMQKRLRNDIEASIRDMSGDKNFTLPAGWAYDRTAFKSYVRKLISEKAQEAWKNKVQSQFRTDIPPGLDQEVFLRYLGVEPLPPLNDLLMSESDFTQNYIVPMNEKAGLAALEKIRNEAPLYANGESLSKQGKDYVRVLYVPAIALCLSLIIVVMTIGRNLVNAVSWIVEKKVPAGSLTQARKGLLRTACWALFLAGVFSLSYLWPNPYTSGAAYRKYYLLAREESKPAAFLLDWVAHMQPVIYRAGAHFQAIFTKN